MDGVLIKLSGMLQSKTSKARYYHGSLSDGRESLRVIGFTAHTQSALGRYFRERLPVSMENCEVKRGRTGAFEIVLNSMTKIVPSKEVFQIPEEVFTSQSMVNTIDKIYELHTFERVTLKAKVVRCGKALKLENGLTKKELIVADTTGTIEIFLWQDDIQKMVINKCYLINNVVVRIYREKKFLSFPKTEASVEEIADMGEVATYYSEEEGDSDATKSPSSSPDTVYAAQVIGVKQLDSYVGCQMWQKNIGPR